MEKMFLRYWRMNDDVFVTAKTNTSSDRGSSASSIIPSFTEVSYSMVARRNSGKIRVSFNIPVIAWISASEKAAEIFRLHPQLCLQEESLDPSYWKIVRVTGFEPHTSPLKNVDDCLDCRVRSVLKAFCRFLYVSSPILFYQLETKVSAVPLMMK